MKVTKAMLRKQVEFLNQNLNRPCEGWSDVQTGSSKTLVANIGHFYLHACSPGDGWTRYGLYEIVNTGGGVHDHFSGNGQDVWAFLRGIDAATRLQAFPRAEAK